MVPVAIAILLILIIILLWRNGCCVKKRFTGALCTGCASCTCKKCPMCKKTDPCSTCPTTEKSCRCLPCKKYKCELKDAFSLARRLSVRDSMGEKVDVEQVPAGEVEKPIVVTDAGSVKVKVPPCPSCDCPACPKQQDEISTYYPIFVLYPMACGTSTYTIILKKN